MRRSRKFSQEKGGGGGAKNNCTCLRGVRSEVYFMQFTKYGLWDTSIFGRTSDRNKQNQA